jgi:hypothetical protein
MARSALISEFYKEKCDLVEKRVPELNFILFILILM